MLATEPITEAAIAIQPAGFHLTLSGDLRVDAVSANIPTILPRSAADCLGRTMAELLLPDTVHDIRNRMALLRDENFIEHLFGCQLVKGGDIVDLSIYRVGDGFGIDIECRIDRRSGDATGLIQGMLARLKPGNDLTALADSGASQLRSLTGHDCVSIHVRGQLLGHSARNRTPPEINLSRPPEGTFMVIDRTAEPIAILTAGQNDCAIARSELRSISPEEAQWLDSAGAKSALLLPLESEGVVIGLASCTSPYPRHLSPERRGIAKLFATLVALRLQVAELRSS